MAEYIDREKAFEAVDKRVNELRGDKEFTLPKEICVLGVIKNLNDIPAADVVERSKIDAAIEEIKEVGYAKEEYGDKVKYVPMFISVLRVLDILKKHIEGIDKE